MLHWHWIDLAEASWDVVGHCCWLTTRAQSACIEFLWWLFSLWCYTGQKGGGGGDGRCSGSLHLLTGTLQTTRLLRSIALHCTAKAEQARRKHRKIALHIGWGLSGQAYGVINAAKKHVQFALKFIFWCTIALPFRQHRYKHRCTFMQTQRHNLSLILTDTRTQVMFLSGDLGSKTLGGVVVGVEGGPASPLWTNRAAACFTSLMSPGPNPDIVWLTGLLTRPPSLPGICRRVTELTFIKGSCMESYGQLTVLSSRRTPKLRNLHSTHPSLFPTIKETMKLLSTVWPSQGPLQSEWQLSFPQLVPLEFGVPR